MNAFERRPSSHRFRWPRGSGPAARRAGVAVLAVMLASLSACSSSGGSSSNAGAGGASVTGSGGSTTGSGGSPDATTGSGGSPDAATGSGGSPDAATGSGGTGGAGACRAIGASCTNKTQCCSLYCHANVCTCNSPGYACSTNADCCPGSTCNGVVCVGSASSSWNVCQACGANVDGGTPCPGGPEYCVGTTNSPFYSYCAQDCTGGKSCPANTTCQPLYDLSGNPTGHSGCLSKSGGCQAADGGVAECGIFCVAGQKCPCAGDTCTSTTLGMVCAH